MDFKVSPVPSNQNLPLNGELEKAVDFGHRSPLGSRSDLSEMNISVPESDVRSEM